MKIFLLCAIASSVVLGGCVLPSPPPLVTIQQTPAPIVYHPGYVVDTLPPGYRTVRHRRSVYYVNRDVYYRPQGRRYVVVQRPY